MSSVLIMTALRGPAPGAEYVHLGEVAPGVVALMALDMPDDPDATLRVSFCLTPFVSDEFAPAGFFDMPRPELRELKRNVRRMYLHDAASALPGGMGAGAPHGGH